MFLYCKLLEPSRSGYVYIASQSNAFWPSPGCSFGSKGPPVDGDMAADRESGPLWWDREVDDDGVQIREDVRQAAHELWPICSARVETTLGDLADAPELMESAVAHVSRYLTRYRTSPFYPQAKSLLSLHFCQELKRRAGRQGRVQPVGLAMDLEPFVRESSSCSSWVEEFDLWLDIEKLHSQITDRSWLIFAMRHLGHDWPEISEKLGIAISTAQNHFRSDFKQAWARLHNAAKSAKPMPTGASNDFK